MSEPDRVHEITVDDHGVHHCAACGQSAGAPLPLPCPGPSPAAREGSDA